MRVYEIAREVGLPNKELIAKIRALGLEVNNHMSSLDPDAVARVKRSLERERVENTVTKRLSSTVLRRRSKATTEEMAAVAPPSRDGNGQGGRAPVRERAAAEPAAARPPMRDDERAGESRTASAPVVRRVQTARSSEPARPRAVEPEPRPEPRAETAAPARAEEARSAAPVESP